MAGRRRYLAVALVAIVAHCGYATADEKDDIKAEKELVEARIALEQLKVKEQYARDLALKEIFGSSTGKEGTLTVGENKTPLLRAMPSGAEAVQQLAKQACATIGARYKAAVLLTEAQQAAIASSTDYLEVLARQELELAESLEAATGRSVAAAAAPLVIIPVVASAIVSILKLFRSDVALGVSSNAYFSALFDDLVKLLPECKATFATLDKGDLKEAAIELSRSYQRRRARDLDLIVQAEAYLKDKDNNKSDPVVRVRGAKEALSAAIGVLSPATATSKLGEYAAASALRAAIGDAPQVTMVVETQQIQVSKSNIFTGQHLERAGAAHTIYRVWTRDRQLLEVGYLEYSTAQVPMNVESEEQYSLIVPTPSPPKAPPPVPK